MGGDGGSIPRREELVRTRQKQQPVGRDIRNDAKWKYCAITQEPLKPPICACPLGRLYNKEAVIHSLLNKTSNDIELAKHIRSIKDIKELNLTKNSAFVPGSVDKGDVYKDYNIAQFICPIVGLEMNGKYRFCIIWSCGCVLSERALKEMKSDLCPKCGLSYSPDDVIVIYGTDEEVAQYSTRMENKRQEQKLAKKNKKLKTDPDIEATDTKSSATKRKTDTEQPSTSGTIKDKTVDKKDPPDKNAKKIKSELQNNPKNSAVYKSLFTTSETAKEQPKAHWVTYNPLYY